MSVKLGISKAQLSRILSDKRGAGAKTLEGLLKAFPEAEVEKLFLAEVLPKRNTNCCGNVDIKK